MIAPLRGWSRAPLVPLLLGNACLAVGPWLVRLAGSAGRVDPIAAAFWRLALAAPVIVVLACWLERDEAGRTRSFLPLLIFAGVFFAADLASWHLGIARTKLANAALLGNAASILFPAWGLWALRCRPTRVQTGGLGLALLGAVLLIGRSAEFDLTNLSGDLLCLLAGVLYTVYLVIVGRARSSLPPWSTLMVTTLAGMPVLLALTLASGERVWPHDWGALIALALVAQVAGQVLLTVALGRVDPVVVGVALLGQPVIGAAIGWLGYGERLALLDILGAAAIAGAILLVTVKRSPRLGDMR